MSTSYELRCRECGKTWGNQPRSICEDCFSPLEVSYDYDAIRTRISRELFTSRAPNIWRYRELLPLPAGYQPSLPVGYTPLVSAPQLGRQIGSNNLHIKNDAVCLPTLSFKDRVVAVALANARAFGFDTVACSSTGNLANSVAAQAAREGFKAWIFIPADLEPAKILGTQVFGAQATGCSPIATAIKQCTAEIEPQKPATIARSLAIGNPADGHYAIKAITTSGGWSEDVSDAEVIGSIQLLAQSEGIFTETAGGVTVGTARKLIRQDRILPDETTVLCVTGNGLKTTDVLADKYECEAPIAPKLREFEVLLESKLSAEAAFAGETPALPVSGEAPVSLEA